MTLSKNRYKYTENIPELYVNSMDAKKVLEKYGWKEGQGLGKEGHGRAEPIKVFMKRDNGGVSQAIIFVTVAISSYRLVWNQAKSFLIIGGVHYIIKLQGIYVWRQQKYDYYS